MRKTILMFLCAVVMAGCEIISVITGGAGAIGGELTKVPTMTAHTDGNPERIAAYQCKDGYFKARDRFGVLWCDSTDNFERYPLDQDVPRCNGVTVTDTHRPTQCVDPEIIAAEFETEE